MKGKSPKEKHTPTEFRAVAHHDPKSGYAGKYVPVKPAVKKAAAKAMQFLAKKGVI